MHNVEVFVNYDPPCNSVSTARRLNKRSSSSRRRHQAAVPAPPANSKHSTSSPLHRLRIEHLDRKQHLAAILLVSLYAVGQDQQWCGRLAARSAHQSPGQEPATHVLTYLPALQRSQTNFPERAYGLRKETSTSSAAQISSNPGQGIFTVGTIWRGRQDGETTSQGLFITCWAERRLKQFVKLVIESESRHSNFTLVLWSFLIALSSTKAPFDIKTRMKG